MNGDCKAEQNDTSSDRAQEGAKHARDGRREQLPTMAVDGAYEAGRALDVLNVYDQL